MTIPTMTLGEYWLRLTSGFTFVEGRQYSFGADVESAKIAIEHWVRYFQGTEEYQRRGYGAILINRVSVTPTVIEALKQMGYQEGTVVQKQEVALGIFDVASCSVIWLDCGGKYVRPVLQWLGYVFNEEV